MQELLAQIGNTPALDWVAMALSLIYVVLAARDSDWCWLFAAAGTLVWAHQMWAVYYLLFDALLQVFYFAMAIVGLYNWRRQRRKKQEVDTLDAVALRTDTEGTPVYQMRLRQHLLTVGGSLIGGLLLGQFMRASSTTASLPELDAITTLASVAATFLLIQRYLENWLYWVVIDAAYVFIYWRTGGYVYLLVMLVYIVVAVYGYRHWRGLPTVDRRYEAAA